MFKIGAEVNNPSSSSTTGHINDTKNCLRPKTRLNSSWTYLVGLDQLRYISARSAPPFLSSSFFPSFLSGISHRGKSASVRASVARSVNSHPRGRVPPEIRWRRRRRPRSIPRLRRRPQVVMCPQSFISTKFPSYFSQRASEPACLPGNALKGLSSSSSSSGKKQQVATRLPGN